MRIGQGFDAHVFEAGRPLVLCGVQIPFGRGLAAHSDGDVAIHALCDALLGAAALGDIGYHFPDTDSEYANIDSRYLLRHVVNLLSQQKYRIENVDLTIIAQVPRLAPHINGMKSTLATDLEIPPQQVNVKATTTEHMGFTGREEGIAVLAVCLITS